MARDQSGSPSADELFVEFIARRESGEDVVFEDFCAQHADHATALRQHLADWERLPGVLQKLCISGSQASSSVLPPFSANWIPMPFWPPMLNPPLSK